jgi:hypothetical protein
LDKTGIALFVYNRPQHTCQVLEGLKRNSVKKLYIFADGLKLKSQESDFNEVRNLLNHVDWCETELICSQENKGLSKSIVFGINYILKKHNRIIVLEDDCVPADDFILFMEKCLIRYENEIEIMSVSGDSHPIIFPQDYAYNIYFGYRASSWGWGTWKRAWSLFNNDISILTEIRKDRSLYRRVKKIGEDLILVLELQDKGLADSWAVFWALTIIKNKGICINSVQPKIKNIGMDGTGTHCGKTEKYEKVFSQNLQNEYLFPEKVFINNDIIKNCSHFFKLNWIGKIKRLLIRIDHSGRLFKIIRNWVRQF